MRFMTEENYSSILCLEMKQQQQRDCDQIILYIFIWLGLIIEMGPLAVFKTAKWFNYDDVQFFYYFYKQ